MTDAWFGGSWQEISRVVTTTLAIYVTVVAGLRIAGRRTVSQMSAFDFVVTIAIGSLVANTALSPDSNYLHGVAAIGALLVAQQIVAVVRQRFPRMRRFLDFEPQPIYTGGELKLRHSPLTAQVTEAELYSKLRREGIEELDQVSVVILEPDGRVSVMRRDPSRSEAPQLWQS